MAKIKSLPSRDWLIEHLRYEPETGLLWWKKSCQGRKMDQPAGVRHWSNRNGMPTDVSVTCLGVQYLAHRLIWRIMTGEDPGELTVDHIDRDPFNNRFSNLRLADARLQLRNKRPFGKSLHKGVTYISKSGKWRALGWVNGKQIHLGIFEKEAEAAAAAAPYYIH